MAQQNKIMVTQEQRDRLLEAREFWLTVEPGKVIPGLHSYRKETDCGTIACFGGWIAEAGLFGTRPSDVMGAPSYPNWELASAKELLGHQWMFAMREKEGFSDPVSGKRYAPEVSDHALVLDRIDWLLANSEVA